MTCRRVRHPVMPGLDETRRRHRQSKVSGTARRQTPAAVMELTTVSRPGDPRFLQEAREALEASLRVSATLTPSAAASPPVTLDPSTLSDEELAVVERLRGRSTVGVSRASRRRSPANNESHDEEDR